MSILEKLKEDVSLFYNPHQDDEPEDYLERFERLHRNGMSDEEWEAKKREHPGLFTEPSFNHVGKTHEESRTSEILGRNGLSDEEWEARKREHPGLFSEPSFNHVGKTHEESRTSEILGRNGLSDEEWEARKREHPGLFSEPSFNHVGKTKQENCGVFYNSYNEDKGILERVKSFLALMF